MDTTLSCAPSPGRFAPRLAAPDAWVLATDPRHQDAVIAVLVTQVARRGKRSLAQRIVHEAVRLLRKRFPGVRSAELVRRGLGSSARVPRGARGLPTDLLLFPLARAAVRRARGRRGGTMALRLTEELAEAYRRGQPPPPPPPLNKALAIARASRGG